MQFLIDIGLTFLYVCIFLLLCTWAWRFWMMYVNQKFLSEIKWVMLEIKLPREINKSPLATEIALASLLQGGGIGNTYSKVFKGNLPMYASLEIASLEGVIHFYIRAQQKFRPLIEANFYAQYPGIEIVEADDYTQAIRYHHLTKDTSMWGASFRTSKDWSPINPETGKAYEEEKDKELKMKADFLPIKTYVDFGLDKDPKEEFKIDPITPLLEMMGGMGKGEYMWYQVLVQDESVYNKKMPKFYVNKVNHEHMSLNEMAKAFKIQKRTAGYIKHGQKVFDEYGYERTRKEQDGVDENDKPKFKEVPLTYKFEEGKEKTVKPIGKKEIELTFEEKEELESVNKKFSKPLALCVMRLLYVSKGENFKAENIQNILSYPKPFNGVNSFAPSPSNPYDYPWEDIGGKRSAWRTEEMFEEYVEREGFFPHIKKRDGLDKWEDLVFWTSSMKHRKIFRMLYEAIFHPFDHPHADDAFTLNLEELATLWHLPGAVAGTPTLPRIDSNKGVAPVNLPI